jgi:AraC family transcriptional regulator
MNYRLVDKPAFEAVGWTFRTTVVDGANMREIPQFWDRCHADGKVDALMAASGSFGLLGLCGDFDPTGLQFTYVIGVEAVPGGPVLPPGTQSVKLPAATYAVFGCTGAMPDGIQNGWRSIMGEWFPSSGYEQDGPTNFELYPSFPDGDERGDPTSPRAYTEIWIPVRKKG